MAELSRKEKAALRKVSLYKSVFSGTEGKAVLHDMMNAHGMLTPGFSKDPLEMARMAGERNVIVRIMTYLKVNERQLERMMQEAHNAAQADIG